MSRGRLWCHKMLHTEEAHLVWEKGNGVSKVSIGYLHFICMFEHKRQPNLNKCDSLTSPQNKYQKIKYCVLLKVAMKDVD